MPQRMISVSLSTSTYAYDKYILSCMSNMSQISLNFYLHQQVFACWNGLTGFFPHWGFIFFHKPGLIGFFSSWRFYYSASQPDPLIVGASDIGHGYYGPENRWSGPGIKPWTHMLQGQGIEPWTYKKDRMQGQGFKPWTNQKNHLYNCACDH